MLDVTAMCGLGVVADTPSGARYWRLRLVNGTEFSGSPYFQMPYFPVTSIEFMTAAGEENLSFDPSKSFSNLATHDGLLPSYVFDGTALLGSSGTYTFHKQASGGRSDIVTFPNRADFAGKYYGYDFTIPRNPRAVRIVGLIFSDSAYVDLAIDKSSDGLAWQEVHAFRAYGTEFIEPGYGDPELGLNARTEEW